MPSSFLHPVYPVMAGRGGTLGLKANFLIFTGDRCRSITVGSDMNVQETPLTETVGTD